MDSRGGEKPPCCSGTVMALTGAGTGYRKKIFRSRTALCFALTPADQKPCVGLRPCCPRLGFFRLSIRSSNLRGRCAAQYRRKISRSRTALCFALTPADQKPCVSLRPCWLRLGFLWLFSRSLNLHRGFSKSLDVRLHHSMTESG